MSTRAVEKLTVNQAEAAVMLGVSESMVRKLCSDGTLPIAKLGKCVRILEADVLSLFRKRVNGKEVDGGREAAQAG